MKQITLTILNKLGLHARPCALIVGRLEQFNASVKFDNGIMTVDAKSILSLMQLAASQDCNILITIDGLQEEEEEIIKILTELFNSKFKEAYI